MIAADEALRLILDSAHPLAPTRRPLLDSLGCTLAEDLHAGEDLPQWPYSAMDGYAVVARSTELARPEAPVRLRVVGTIGAGQHFGGTVGPGEALKIMTGAPFPAGADAVVMVEETDGASTGDVAIRRAAHAGEHVRPKGEEVRAGERVLSRGRPVRPAEIGMAAALGKADLLVHPQPTVAILPTGDELREPGQPLGPGLIRNSNGYSLAAQAASVGARVLSLGIARDDRDELREKMKRGLQEADVLVTSGGVSMGEFDFVSSLLAELGGKILFDRVAIAPGKPITFATTGSRLIFGLPGNPVSSMVTFELFVRPALRKLAGAARLERPRVEAVLATDFRKRPGRRFYLRCTLARTAAGLVATPTGTQSSGVLRSMALANALVIIESEVDTVAAGSPVQAILLDAPEDSVPPEA